MKKIFYLIIPVIALIFIYSLLGGESDQSYIDATEKLREDRINYLKNGADSPFQRYGIDFQPPQYFPIDPSYKVNAKLERMTTPERLVIKNSDESSNIYLKFAYAQFTLNEQKHQLLILKPAGMGSINKFFTAFADNTSAVTTYGGGRYLDLEIGKSDRIVIDFNLAYNPYCAYVADYSCPLPPPENILSVSIEAGEKDYKH